MSCRFDQRREDGDAGVPGEVSPIGGSSVDTPVAQGLLLPSCGGLPKRRNRLTPLLCYETMDRTNVAPPEGAVDTGSSRERLPNWT